MISYPTELLKIKNREEIEPFPKLSCLQEVFSIRVVATAALRQGYMIESHSKWRISRKKQIPETISIKFRALVTLSFNAAYMHVLTIADESSDSSDLRKCIIQKTNMQFFQKT